MFLLFLVIGPLDTSIITGAVHLIHILTTLAVTRFMAMFSKHINPFSSSRFLFCVCSHGSKIYLSCKDLDCVLLSFSEYVVKVCSVYLNY